MNRKLSIVSTEELEKAESQLHEIYDHYCEQGGKKYITRSQLQQFAQEGNLVDKKLTVPAIGLTFDGVVVGNKPGLKFPRFMEACRRLAVEKEITYQNLVIFVHW